jgi:hypothetical protein
MASEAVSLSGALTGRRCRFRMERIMPAGRAAAETPAPRNAGPQDLNRSLYRPHNWYTLHRVSGGNATVRIRQVIDLPGAYMLHESE